jgi:hypothetical protein
MSGRSLARLSTAALALVLVLVVAACGGSSGGSGTASTTPVAANLSADQIAQQSQAKMAQLKSAAYTADLTLQVNGDASKITDPTQKALLSQGIKVHVQGKSNVQPAASDMTMSLDFAGQNLDLSMVAQGSKAWIEFQSQWYVMDAKTAKGLGPLTGSGATPMGELQKMGLDPQTMGATYTLVGTERVAGTPVYHVKATVDPKKLSKALAQASKDPKIAESLGGQLKQLEQLGGQGTATGTQGLEKALKGVSIDYWVGTSDLLVRKVNAVFGVNPPAGSKGASASPGMTMTMTMTMAAFDQPVTVTPPANALPLSQLMNQMFGGTLNGAGGTSY